MIKYNHFPPDCSLPSDNAVLYVNEYELTQICCWVMNVFQQEDKLLFYQTGAPPAKM